jgi:hypothetical protein
MKRREENWNLFPVKYDDRLWNEDECDDIFLSFYSCIEALNVEGGVYVAEGICVYPDGKMEEY